MRIKWHNLDTSQVVVRPNVQYAGRDDYFNQLDLFVPKNTQTDKFVLFVHGGAWIGGSRTLAGRYERVGIKLAQKGIPNAIVSYHIAVNYRNQVKDVLKSIEWVRQSEEFGKMKLVLCGESAGGHLASVATLDQQLHQEVDFDPSFIKAVIGIGGVYDINLLAKIPLLKQTIMKIPFGLNPQQWSEASPVNMVHENAPPFLLINAQFDFHLHTDTLAMENKLKSFGVPVEKFVVKNSTHMTNLLGRRSVVLQKVAQFVNSL